MPVGSVGPNEPYVSNGLPWDSQNLAAWCCSLNSTDSVTGTHDTLHTNSEKIASVPVIQLHSYDKIRQTVSS
jgi:hypothetical protein